MSALALVVEAVDAVDGSTLVVASQQEEVLGVLDLVRKQEADSLKRLFASIDVVPKEQVVRLWGESAVLKQAEQVVVLSVHVAYRK